MQNGEATHKVTPEDKGQTKTTTNQEIKYKRPPPRPPSLGTGSGMGLLFSSPPSPQTSSTATPAAARKEEGKGGGGEREERKSVSTSPSPLRPPAPLQNRVAPPLPPAPLCRTSSRKSAERGVGEGTEREKGQNSAKKIGGEDRGEEKSGLSGEGIEQESSSQNQEEEIKMDREKKEKDNEKEAKECPSLAKRPSRPVPPPRRKPNSSDPPVGPKHTGAGLANQIAGMKAPTPAQRPDVSLYSPQGGTVQTTDPDSGSTSSTEEEGEPNQGQEQNHR